jgi:hypothetical protein
VKGFAACEPDVVLGLETITNQLYLLFIEAKYRSGPSSEIDENELPHHQLSRELDQLSVVSCTNLEWETYSKPTQRWLLYVTKDNTMPVEDIQKGCDEYKSKRRTQGEIYWTSWCKLPSILEEKIEHEVIPEFRIVMEDMLQLLDKKWLVYFRGVDSVQDLIPIPGFYKNENILYLWPGIHLAPSYYFIPTTSRYFWPVPLSNPDSYEYKAR